MQLFIEDPAAETSHAVVLGGGAVTDSNSFGYGGSAMTFSPGIVVKPGKRLCVRCVTGGANHQCQSTGQGYFAKDEGVVPFRVGNSLK